MQGEETNYYEALLPVDANLKGRTISTDCRWGKVHGKSVGRCADDLAAHTKRNHDQTDDRSQGKKSAKRG